MQRAKTAQLFREGRLTPLVSSMQRAAGHASLATCTSLEEMLGALGVEGEEAMQRTLSQVCLHPHSSSVAFVVTQC